MSSTYLNTFIYKTSLPQNENKKEWYKMMVIGLRVAEREVYVTYSVRIFFVSGNFSSSSSLDSLRELLDIFACL